MPANLPPQYYEEEKRLKAARTQEEKIEILEALLSIIPKHKGTEKLQADLKSRLSKARSMETKKSGASRRGKEYHVDKQGAGQVVLAGLPNVGKSQILAALTNAIPLIADYPYSTLKPLPGMARYENVWIQFVDVPPLLWEVTDPWVSNLLRNADALCLVVELNDDPVGQVEIILDELPKRRIRPLTIGESADDQPGTYPKRVLIVGSKLDLEPSREGFTALCTRCEDLYPVTGVSAQKGIGLDQLSRESFLLLGRIRVYTKSPGKKPDTASPFIIRNGSTVMDLAEEIHKDFVIRLKAARIYSSDMYNGQRVAKDFVLRDGDIIELLV
jgi:ribosome-interacting GTPase 1